MRSERNEFDVNNIIGALTYGVKLELLYNTFAEGCYNDNTIEELLEIFYLRQQNYQADIKNWPALKTKAAWHQSQVHALLQKLRRYNDAGKITLSVDIIAEMLYAMGLYIHYKDVGPK